LHAAWAGVALVLVLAVGAQPARPQEPTDAELIRRIEALRPQLEEARVARDARYMRNQEEEGRRTPTRVDTVRVGPLLIVSLPDEVDTARELFEEVWLESFQSVRESPSLARHTFVIQWRARIRALNVELTPGGELVRVDISRVWAPTREHAKVVVADAIARGLVQDFPTGSPVRSWLTAQARPRDDEAYRLLATASSASTHECLAGDDGACRAALGLDMRGTADRLPSWFAAEDRLKMVEWAAREDRVSRDAPLVRACLEDEEAPACDAVIDELGWVTNPPVSDRLRAHLLWFAMREGGEQAWQRALERRGAPIPEALSHIGARPIEQLVADWRDELVARRPDVHAGLGPKGTRALLWSLIFAALAMRSTRWRLG
jgi:hypothetical protein